LLIEAAPTDPTRLLSAADRLDQYGWVICASVRAVEAVGRSMSGPWPASVRTAAVGPATARALEALGAQAPALAAVEGAEPLWDLLSQLDQWPGRRVLVLTTPGGRTTLIDELRAAGAEVDAVEAYRMVPRRSEDITRDWAAAATDALVVASPKAVEVLLEAVGRDALKRLRAVVAIGETTAQALAARGIPCHIPERASFDAVADVVAKVLETGVRS
jgi:uroporphyrinogen-III synthase